jgi:hypothetical protein
MTKWKNINIAPKDGKMVLLDIGLPWAVVGSWNVCEKKWVYANIQVNMVDGEYNDPYFENELEAEFDSNGRANIKGWQFLPVTTLGDEMLSDDDGYTDGGCEKYNIDYKAASLNLEDIIDKECGKNVNKIN